MRISADTRLFRETQVGADFKGGGVQASTVIAQNIIRDEGSSRFGRSHITPLGVVHPSRHPRLSKAVEVRQRRIIAHLCHREARAYRRRRTCPECRRTREGPAQLLPDRRTSCCSLAGWKTSRFGKVQEKHIFIGKAYITIHPEEFPESTCSTTLTELALAILKNPLEARLLPSPAVPPLPCGEVPAYRGIYIQVGAQFFL